MNENPMEQKQKTIVKKGFSLLKLNCNYSQAEVVLKLKYLGYHSSKAALNKILKDNKSGSDAYWNNSKGIADLVYKELGYKFEGGSYVKEVDLNWKPFVVPTGKSAEEQRGFDFNEYGRMTIQDKVAFFSSAQKNMYEFGLTLNTFSSYFENRNPMEFKQPIIDLLRKGVVIKCYLLEPDRNEANMYFADRAKVPGFEKELKSGEKIKEVIERLKQVHREFSKAHYPGRFELYSYRHIPTNYFLVIDDEKMMVSHYLYGKRRSENPVLSFTKQAHPFLFKTYWESLQWMIKEAKQVF